MLRIENISPILPMVCTIVLHHEPRAQCFVMGWQLHNHDYVLKRPSSPNGALDNASDSACAASARGLQQLQKPL
jgi:hypothetical protein